MQKLEAALTEAKRSRSLPSAPACRLLRERAGLTQEHIAQALGVSRATISRYETGDRKPRGVVRLRYVEVLDRLAVEPLREA
jgi:transcriptional regulator with XRE-family HTH domain